MAESSLVPAPFSFELPHQRLIVQAVHRRRYARHVGGEEEGEAVGVGVVELCEEEGAEVESAGARDGLQAGDALILDGWAVGTEDELLGGGGVIGQAGNRQVLVVEVGVVA